jgi:hypothetical protein
MEPEVSSHFHNNPPLSQMNSTRSYPSIFYPVEYHLTICACVFQAVFYFQVFPPKLTRMPFIFHACHMICSSQLFERNEGRNLEIGEKKVTNT